MTNNSHTVHKYTNKFIKGYLKEKGFHYNNMDENGNLIITKNGKTFSIRTSGNTQPVINHKIGGIDKFTSEFVILVSNVYLDVKNVDRRIFILPTTHVKYLKHSSKTSKSTTPTDVINVIDYLSYEVDNHNIDKHISINALNSHPIEPAWRDLKTVAVELVRRLHKHDGCRISDTQKGCDLVIIDNYNNSISVDVYPSEHGFRYPPISFIENSTADVIIVVSNGKIGVVYPSTHSPKRNKTANIKVDSNPERFDITQLNAMYIINHHGRYELIGGLRNGDDIEKQIIKIKQREIEQEKIEIEQRKIEIEQQKIEQQKIEQRESEQREKESERREKEKLILDDHKESGYNLYGYNNGRYNQKYDTLFMGRKRSKTIKGSGISFNK